MLILANLHRVITNKRSHTFANMLYEQYKFEDAILRNDKAQIIKYRIEEKLRLFEQELFAMFKDLDAKFGNI